MTQEEKELLLSLSYIVTEKNLDSIDNQYCSKKIRHTVFSKDRYDRVNLSNGRWLDNSKPFLEEFSKKNEYWGTLSKNSVLKCESVDDMVNMIVRVLSPYLHFKIDGRSYDYINIKSILAKDENDVGNLWYAERWLKSIKERMKGE